MKTEFLKGLGIESQEVIDKIMAENGKDVNAAKKNTEQLETQVSGLQEQINERDKQLKQLKDSAKDNESLLSQIQQLQEDNKTAKADYDAKIADMQKSNAIEIAVRDAKAKNAKAVIALLDTEKIKMVDGQLVGISEQLDALTKGEDTNFLFADTNPPAPSGAQPGGDPNMNGRGNQKGVNRELGGLSLSEAIANTMNQQSNKG